MAAKPEFGVQVMAAMYRRGTNQTEVSKAIGRTRGQVNEVINGRAWNPSIANALKDYLEIDCPYETATAIAKNNG